MARVRQSEIRKLGKDQITQCLIRFLSLSQEQEGDYWMLLSREISYSFYLALNKIKKFPVGCSMENIWKATGRQAKMLLL